MYLLLADDLTGGNDAGIQFATRGLSVRIALSADQTGLDAVLNGSALPETLVVNANTRNASLEETAARAREVARRLATDARTANPALVFKKIDSTLRGYFGVEIDALMDAYGFTTAFLCPAYCELGRTVVDGRLLVDGVPVHETSFAKDPLTPVRQSSVAGMAAAQSRRSVGHAPLSIILAGQEKLAAHVEELQRAGKDIIVFDASSPEHLDLLVAVGRSMSKQPLYVGAAGLAKALAARLPASGKEENVEHPRADRVFFLCGSAHRVTREQVAALAEDGVPVIQMTRLEDARPDAQAATVETLSEALRRGDAVLTTPAPEGEADLAAGVALSKALGAVAVSVLEKMAAQKESVALVMTGGETAFAVLRTICSGLSLSRELSPGVALGAVVGGLCDGVTVVTKAGGFGDAQTLVDLLHLFRPELRR